MKYLVVLLSISYVLSVLLISTIEYFWSGGVRLHLSTFWMAVGVTVLLFYPMVELGFRIRTRMFLRRLGMNVTPIRSFKNHLRIYYLADGKEMSKKWPQDFKEQMGDW